MAYEAAPKDPIPEAGFYYHYKHDPAKGIYHHAYYIYGVGVHTEDDCPPQDQFMQVYRPLYEALVYKLGKMFDLRPLHMFYEKAQWQGREVERFTRITDPAVIQELRRVMREMYPEEPGA
jgi:hypothetical protein